MNIDKFKDLLETFGAELSRWPDDVQDSAFVFLQKSQEAKDLFIEESKLDSVISPKGNASALLEKIMSGINDIEDDQDDTGSKSPQALRQPPLQKIIYP